MTQRDRIAITVVVAVALLAAYWFLLLSPKRGEAETVKGQVSAQEQRLQAAQADLAASQAARTSYAANYTAVARLGKAVPADDDVPSLVYQLDTTADASTVDFQSIKLTASAASAAPAPAPAPPPAAKPGEPGSSTPVANDSGAASTAPASAPPTQAATAALPPGAVVGPAGLATMPFSFTFNGSFSRLSDFFGRIERFTEPGPRGVATSGRLLTINGIALTFGTSGYPKLKATVSATAYLLPVSEGLLNGASPTAPPQSGAQPVSNPGGAPPTAPATAAAP